MKATLKLDDVGVDILRLESISLSLVELGRNS